MSPKSLVPESLVCAGCGDRYNRRAQWVRDGKVCYRCRDRGVGSTSDQEVVAMSTATQVREGWVVVSGGKRHGPVQPSRAAGREYARGKKLSGFKVVRESDAPTDKPRAAKSSTKGQPKSAGGYVPKVRRQCGDCGHYRPRDEQKLVEREVSFKRGGKTITQVRNVAVCANGCRDNVR